MYWLNMNFILLPQKKDLCFVRTFNFYLNFIIKFIAFIVNCFNGYIRMNNDFVGNYIDNYMIVMIINH
jgi:hypothetical protein